MTDPKTKFESTEAFNPFNGSSRAELMNTLNEIDCNDLRTKFKSTADPINLAFDAIEDASLVTLATEFVAESISDVFSFISKICK